MGRTRACSVATPREYSVGNSDFGPSRPPPGVSAFPGDARVGSRGARLFVTLPPGADTAQVKARAGGAGTALVGVYEGR